MRIHRANLGQVTQLTCEAAGAVWNSSANTCTPQAPIGAEATEAPTMSASECAAAGGAMVAGVCTPGLPSGYNAGSSATATGVLPGTVSPSNTIGQTGDTLPSSAEDLCSSEGGTWNGSACDYSGLCSLPLGTYDSDTGTCDYTELYLVAGGGLLIVLALIFSSRGSRRKRR